jgi:hypothetical protein
MLHNTVKKRKDNVRIRARTKFYFGILASASADRIVLSMDDENTYGSPFGAHST